MARAHELIVEALEQGGVDHVFGIPGGGTGQIFGSLYGKDGHIWTILARHEQGAAIMADAYGRATGKPAVIMGQGVFMGSNAAFGIIEAFLSSSPMVILTDTSDGGAAQHPANQSGAGEYGSVDLLNIFRSMTKYVTLATTPKEAVLGTQLAIKHATSGRPGPACVLSPNPPMDRDGRREDSGRGEGVTGAMIRARIWVDGRLAGGLQALLGAPMAAYSGCGEGDGGIGHGKRRSRTGVARDCGDVGLAGGSVADGRRQAGSGMARSRARARLNCSSQGQRRGRCRVNRRAERVIRPAKGKTRRLRVLVVTIC